MLPTGEKISVGGTWAIFEDRALLALADEVNCLPRAPGVWPHYCAPCLYNQPWLMLKLWLIGKDICQNPNWWEHPKAAKLDSMSLAAWLATQKHFSEASKEAVRQWFLIFETFPEDCSFSVFLAAIFVYLRLSNITKTGLIVPRAFRWEGGTGVFVDAIIKAIQDLDGELYYNSPVTKIEQDQNGARVTIANGKTFDCEYVVVAAPPNATTNIRFTPSLPSTQYSLCKSLVGTQNPSLNVILIFEKPWWKEEKVGCNILPEWTLAGEKGVFGPTMELTTMDPNPAAPPRGILRILTTPKRVEGMTEEEIKLSAIDFLKQFYPERCYPHLESVSYIKVINWQEQQPYIQGVTYHWGIGALTKYGSVLRENFKRVYFAGAERAVGGLHWMEGAVQRAEVVAGEILELYGLSNEYYENLYTRSQIALNNIRKEQVGEILSSYYPPRLEEALENAIIRTVHDFSNKVIAELVGDLLRQDWAHIKQKFDYAAEKVRTKFVAAVEASPTTVTKAMVVHAPQDPSLLLVAFMTLFSFFVISDRKSVV